MADPESTNPYASPQAEEQPPRELESWPAWSDAGVVVARPRSVLPERCFVCNAPASKRRLVRRLPWANRQRVNVAIAWFLCRRHHRRQLGAAFAQMAVIWASILAVPPLAFVITQRDFFYLIVAVWFVLIVASGFFSRWLAAGVPVIDEVNPRYVRLKGAGPTFADSLPSSISTPIPDAAGPKATP